MIAPETRALLSFAGDAATRSVLVSDTAPAMRAVASTAGEAGVPAIEAIQEEPHDEAQAPSQ